jgi:hypothetical protein
MSAIQGLAMRRPQGEWLVELAGVELSAEVAAEDGCERGVRGGTGVMT